MKMCVEAMSCSVELATMKNFLNDNNTSKKRKWKRHKKKADDAWTQRTNEQKHVHDF